MFNVKHPLNQVVSQAKQSGITGQVQRLAVDLMQRVLPGADRQLQGSGQGLNSLVNRLRARQSAPVQNPQMQRQPVMAEGGKVGSAMGALRALARKFQDALEAGDHGLAGRVARQMESIAPGSSKEVMDSLSGMEDQVANDKVAMFAKGGKVGPIKAVAKKVVSIKTPKHADNLKNAIWGESDEPDWTRAYSIIREMPNAGHLARKLKRAQKLFADEDSYDEDKALTLFTELEDSIDEWTASEGVNPRPNPNE